MRVLSNEAAAPNYSVLCPQLTAQQQELAVFKPQRDSDKSRLDGDIITRPNNGFTLNYIYGFCDSSKRLWLCHYLEVKKREKKGKESAVVNNFLLQDTG